MLLLYHTNKDYNFGVIKILNPRYNTNKKCHVLYDYDNCTYNRLLLFTHDFLNNRIAIKNINNHKFINIHLNENNKKCDQFLLALNNLGDYIDSISICSCYIDKKLSNNIILENSADINIDINNEVNFVLELILSKNNSNKNLIAKLATKK